MLGKRNYPVVRFGRVALVTEERIEFGNVKAELYLMETNSFGGNSGAPVFFYLGAERNPGSIMIGDPVILLAGIMSGRFDEGNPIQNIETAAIPFYRSNLGIAAVVPGYKLRELLFSEELKAVRHKVVEEEQRKQKSKKK